MPNWFDSLRSKLLQPLGAGRASRLHLGVFGKHPGWDDHLDELGLDTEALLAARQYLYVQGIGGNIDAGAWDALPEGEALPLFKHVFIWSAGDSLLAGRLWASTDGKGRASYPMVLCAQLDDVNDDDALPWILRRLAEWEDACRAVTTAEEVQSIVKRATETAQPEIQALSPAPAPAFAEFVRRAGLDSGDETFARVEYAVDAFLGPLGPDKVNRRDLGLTLKLGEATLVPQHLRLPADASDVSTSLLVWRRLLQPALDRAVPLFLVAPEGEPWLDVIVGPVTTRHLFCLRAAPRALPLTTEVPFTLTEQNRADAEAHLRDLCAEPASPLEAVPANAAS